VSSGRFLDPQRWSRRTHPLWPHVLFLAAQDQSCFPSSPKSTSRKRSSRAEQSRGIQPHSRTPAHPVSSCSTEVSPQRDNPSGNGSRKARRPPPLHHIFRVCPSLPNQCARGIKNPGDNHPLRLIHRAFCHLRPPLFSFDSQPHPTCRNSLPRIGDS